MFVEKEISERSAFIHVDCDGVSSVAGGTIRSEEKIGDTIFESGLPNVLELLDQFKCKATFFVIARDLKKKEKRGLFKEAVRRGHRIASHGFDHLNLTRVTPAEREREIVESRKFIEDSLGLPVIGFRAPGFSMNPKLLEDLEKAGYCYDSSLYASAHLGGAASQSNGTVRDVPFLVNREGRLWEVPLPKRFFGWLPWHASYAMYLGYPFFYLNYAAYQQRHRFYLNLFHLIDFSAAVPTHFVKPYQQRILSGSCLSVRRKRELTRKIMESVVKSYRVMTTEDFLLSAP